jgi:Methyltransferase domain
LSPEAIDIGAIVTEDTLLDFLILHESLVETWTGVPFLLHAFTADEAVGERLENAGAEPLEVHRARSGLEDMILSDPANVFLAEMPELLDSHDLAPLEPLEIDRPRDRLRGPIVRDPYGFVDQQGTRITVVSLPGLGRRGDESVAERIGAAIERFPGAAALLPLYSGFANRAARRLGFEVIPKVRAFTRERLLEAGLIETRRELPELLNRRGLFGMGVEVGVQQGAFSEAILRRWRGRKLISVDSWTEAPRDEYVDVANVTQGDHERFYAQTVERLREFGERSVIWRTTSVEAAARIEPRSLDFIYLDARHDYASVKEDLEAWCHKLRPGGIFSGHDYVDGTLPMGVFGVKSAVDEFFGELGLRVNQTYVTGGRGPALPSWLVELPDAP